MRQIAFHADAWEDYLAWQTIDRAGLKRLNQLIRDIQRDPFVGPGKPEPLKHALAGFWSRRITAEHRIVYTVTDKEIVIAQCRGHYD
jgi:toxin YoeB